MTAGVSVVLCCHNSSTRLPETLRHLAVQRVSTEIPWEIIVVDNNSTDNTYQLAKSEWQQYHLPSVTFTVLSEPKPGKYYALTTGVTQAKYEYIIICDDDNWLGEQYVENAFRVMQSDTSIAAAGGQGIAVADEEIPDWFWAHQHRYAVGPQNDASGEVTNRGYLQGAGMAFRNSLYRKVFLTSPSILLGPDGKSDGHGEDVELCMRFILAGYKLYYDAELVFKHYIHGKRLTENYKQSLLQAGEFEGRVLNLYCKQIQINNSSPPERYLLLCASWSRYLICKAMPGNGKWNYLHEAEIIYLLSGRKTARISDEVVKIRVLNLSLANK